MSAIMPHPMQIMTKAARRDENANIAVLGARS
jgi:hypothetical protein